MLNVSGLTIEVGTRRDRRILVDHVSFTVNEGETVGIVGESGSGKTLTVLGALGLVPDNLEVTAGSVDLCGDDLMRCSPSELRSIRGRVVGVIFQDPLTSLHPSMRISDQLVEAIRVHDRSVSRAVGREQAADLLRRVGVAQAGDRMDDYPHQWSGGMRQRAMIAMAIAHDPALIIADEPTTALDVTVQAKILDLIITARAQTGAAVVLISHDLGVIAQVADRVLVMYDGRVVEEAPVDRLFAAPGHPYTAALLESVPTLDDEPGSLAVIPGHPPAPSAARTGCAFEPRCPLGRGDPLCSGTAPKLTGIADHRVACHYATVTVDSAS